MKNKYNWGSNPYYYLAGQLSIHPTYIQSMQNDLKLSSNEILSAIENLKKKTVEFLIKALLIQVRCYIIKKLTVLGHLLK